GDAQERRHPAAGPQEQHRPHPDQGVAQGRPRELTLFLCPSPKRERGVPSLTLRARTENRNRARSVSEGGCSDRKPQPSPKRERGWLHKRICNDHEKLFLEIRPLPPP